MTIIQALQWTIWAIIAIGGFFTLLDVALGDYKDAAVFGLRTAMVVWSFYLVLLYVQEGVCR
jgi:hypothetical protein